MVQDLNAWLLDKCAAYAEAHHHPELRGAGIGLKDLPAALRQQQYSVVASAVGVHAYTDRVVIRQDGRIVPEQRRSFGRGDTVYDPWHDVLALARKPGAPAQRRLDAACSDGGQARRCR